MELIGARTLFEKHCRGLEKISTRICRYQSEKFWLLLTFDFVWDLFFIIYVLTMSIKKNYEFFKCFNNMEFELIYVVLMENDMDEEIIRHFRLDKEIMQNLQIFVNPLVLDFLQLMVV